MEIELKAVFTAENLVKFLHSSFFREHRIGSSEQVLQLTTVYYDTADWQLGNNGETYRVRTTKYEDGRIEYESTVKRTLHKKGGIAAREEINTPQEDDRPRRQGVQPLFATEIERKIALLQFKEAVLEMAIDRGRLVTVSQKNQETIDEVEFELKKGTTADLEEFKQILRQVAFFKEEDRSKYARGRALWSLEHG